MHIIFGDPYHELLSHLALSEIEIQQLVTREGRCGRLLGMIEHFEEGDVSELNSKEVELLNEIWLDSRVWVEEVLQYMDNEGLSD